MTRSAVAVNAIYAVAFDDTGAVESLIIQVLEGVVALVRNGE